MAKPKAKGTSRASKPRRSATKSPPKAGAKARPGAEAKRATGKAASRLIDERIRSLGGWRAETLSEAAVAENLRSSAPKSRSQESGVRSQESPGKVRKGEKVVLLSGGNPQIAKADDAAGT